MANLDPDTKFLEFLEQSFEEELDFYPQKKTIIGRKDAMDKLDSYSPQAFKAINAFWRNKKDQFALIDPTLLNSANKLNYDLYSYLIDEKIAEIPWTYHEYVLEHKRGPHVNFPVFMANNHEITNIEEARSYITRVRAVEEQLSGLTDFLYEQKAKGIFLPRFVYEEVLTSIKQLLRGYPFEQKRNLHPIWQDFAAKIENKAWIGAQQKKSLQEDLKIALIGNFKRAYKKLSFHVKNIKKLANSDLGAWKHEQGDSYYQHKIKRYTSLDISPAEVHQLGLKEVQRIHNEMTAIMAKIGFQGTLKDFFSHVNNRPQAYCSAGKKGRAECLKMNRNFINNIKNQQSKYLSLKIKDDLLVKGVETYREKTSALAFYERPSLDHRRPGIYYLNLVDPKRLPIYELEALAYHEGIPGHHLQISISQNVKLPNFRKFYFLTAFSEGWALYAEKFPKELGFYEDPYSDYGRLSMELWRACRLVLDTGIHAKKWTKEQAISYLLENTSRTEAEAVSSTERYTVWPGQAISYKIGMNHIMTMREKAKKRLGKNFNLADFHDQILNSGSLPLFLLEEKIDRWLQDRASHS